MTDKVKLFPDSSSGGAPPVLPSSTSGDHSSHRPRKRVRGRVLVFLIVLLLLGGGGYAVWYFLLNGAVKPSASTATSMDVSGQDDAFVTITEGAAIQPGWGNGFIIERNGDAYLLAQPQVLMAYEQPVIFTASGKVVHIDKDDVYLSRNLGLVAVRVSNADDLFSFRKWSWSAHPLRLMDDVKMQAHSGDSIYLGDAFDRPEELDEARGQITRIGSRTVEHTLPLNELDNGCPLIHADSGEVIGVVAGSTIDVGNRTQSEVFVFRLDNVEDWQRSDLLR